jgi:hypothetical protein
MKQVKVRVNVAHAGPHGSYIKGDETLLDSDVAKRLERVGYVEILKSGSKEESTATDKKDKEER